MFTVRQLIEAVGNPIRAESVLMGHYTHKKALISRWDKRYAQMNFISRWAGIYRRHVDNMKGEIR